MLGTGRRPLLHFFDGKVFEFQGNCTYTLIHILNDTSENNTVWVREHKDRTPNEASSVNAIHVKVAKDNITIYSGGKVYPWVSLNLEMQTVPSPS